MTTHCATSFQLSFKSKAIGAGVFFSRRDSLDDFGKVLVAYSQHYITYFKMIFIRDKDDWLLVMILNRIILYRYSGRLVAL